jgi:hypothetical protein
MKLLKIVIAFTKADCDGVRRYLGDHHNCLAGALYGVGKGMSTTGFIQITQNILLRANIFMEIVLLKTQRPMKT